MSSTTRTARDLLAVLRAGMAAPDSIKAYTFEHGGEDYICVTETADGAGDFVYIAADVATWLENREPTNTRITTYGDFCDSVRAVDDVNVARACYEAVGLIPCAPGACERILVEAAGVALVSKAGVLMAAGADEDAARDELRKALETEDDVHLAGDDLRAVPCTRHVLRAAGGDPLRMVPGLTGDVLDLV